LKVPADSHPSPRGDTAAFSEARLHSPKGKFALSCEASATTSVTSFAQFLKYIDCILRPVALANLRLDLPYASNSTCASRFSACQLVPATVCRIAEKVMLSNRHLVVGLGELLWDLLPAGKQLGGAPANFAYITNLLGDTGIPASRLGHDSLGDEALQRLTQLSLNAASVQQDPIHPTGTVNVEIDPGGQPRFDIADPVAWDFLEWTPAWQQLASEADAVCFGSLAQRSSQGRSTIRSFLHAARPGAVRIFDVNLRQNFYTTQVLAESMKLATIVKLNHEELPKIMRLLELEHRGEEASARRLLSSHDLKLVCVTRGSGGSLLV
jgi:fructokinase